MNTTNATALTPVPHRLAVLDLTTNPLRTADDVAAAFLAGYKPPTREVYARDLRHWGRFLAELGVKVLEARRVHVDAYCRTQEAAGASPSSIGRRLSAISGFYLYAADEDLIAKSPVTRVRRPKRSDESPRQGVDRDQLRALLAVAANSGPRNQALVTLLALSGLRISEALAADVDDLASERGHRTLSITRKGGKRQRIALAAPTVAALEALIGDRTSGPIFVTRTGARLDRYSAAKTVRRLARTAGIEHAVSPHSLRHGFVTAALDAGVALRDVQDAAGHADPRTTRRYDRSRHSLDRAATYAVAAFVA